MNVSFDPHPRLGCWVLGAQSSRSPGTKNPGHWGLQSRLLPSGWWLYIPQPQLAAWKPAPVHKPAAIRGRVAHRRTCSRRRRTRATVIGCGLPIIHRRHSPSYAGVHQSPVSGVFATSGQILNGDVTGRPSICGEDFHAEKTYSLPRSTLGCKQLDVQAMCRATAPG